MSTEIVIAVATVGATVVSIFAVIIASKAASAADKSADAALKTLHRSAVRDLVGTCHELVGEDLRIQSLAQELKSEQTALAVFTGNLHGSAYEQMKAKLQSRVEESSNRTTEARALAADHKKLFAASDGDLDQTQARLESSRIVVRNIREDLARELASIGEQNQVYRERQT